MTKSPPPPLPLPPPPPRPPPPAQRQGVRCPRCDSNNTKFCYYNNYSLAQPRHFCKTCRRYWTQGGSLRNIPLGGSSRRIKKPSLTTSSFSVGVSPSPEFQLAGLGQFYPPNLSPFGDHLNLNTAFAVGGPPLNVLGGGPFCHWKELGHEMSYYNEDNIYQKSEGVGPPGVMSDVFFENLEEEVGVTNPHFQVHHHHDHHGDVVAGGGHNAVDGDGGEISTKWLFGGGSSSCSNANNDESGDQNGDARVCSSLTRRMSW